MIKVPIAQIYFFNGYMKFKFRGRDYNIHHSKSKEDFNLYKKVLIKQKTKYHEFRIENDQLNPFDISILIRLMEKTKKDQQLIDQERIKTIKRENDKRINGWKKSKSWSRVTFENKRIIFQYGSIIYPFNNIRSIKAYNFIKKYFSYNSFSYQYNLKNNIPIDFIIADKILDVLEKAIQRDDFSDFKFRNYTTSGYWYGDYDSWSLANLLGYDKKEYFDYLMELANDKIIFLNENKSFYSSDSISIELTFLIKVDKGINRYFIWESSKPNTATIVFETSLTRSDVEQVEQQLKDFLISPVYNKRQNLRNNRVGFIDGILNTYFIRHIEHENIIDWKMKLNNVVRTKKK